MNNIIDYWSQHEDECGLSIDWAEADERCWRCGYKKKLQFCHIIPDSMGGTDEPSNLVLLCHRCHREGPNVTDPRFMWIWVRAHGTAFYDTYWTIRGMEEFEKMFQRKPFINIDNTNISPEEVNKALQEAIQTATFHFGEGGMNPSTIASVIYLVEEQFLKKIT